MREKRGASELDAPLFLRAHRYISIYPALKLANDLFPD